MSQRVSANFHTLKANNSGFTSQASRASRASQTGDLPMGSHGTWFR